MSSRASLEKNIEDLDKKNLLALLEKTIKERDAARAHYDGVCTQFDEAVAQRDEALDQRDAALNELNKSKHKSPSPKNLGDALYFNSPGPGQEYRLRYSNSNSIPDSCPITGHRDRIGFQCAWTKDQFWRFILIFKRIMSTPICPPGWHPPLTVSYIPQEIEQFIFWNYLEQFHWKNLGKWGSSSSMDFLAPKEEKTRVAERELHPDYFVFWRETMPEDKCDRCTWDDSSDDEEEEEEEEKEKGQWLHALKRANDPIMEITQVKVRIFQGYEED